MAERRMDGPKGPFIKRLFLVWLMELRLMECHISNGSKHMHTHGLSLLDRHVHSPGIGAIHVRPS